jgi:protein required for attachment to host cells
MSQPGGAAQGRHSLERRWIVVADGGAARVLALNPERNGLAVLHEMESADRHSKTHDIVSDRPGRSFESASPTRHGVEAKTDPHELSKERFVEAVAGWLNGQASAFDDLVLIVTPAQASTLTGALEPAVRERVREVITKDLVKTPNPEIMDRLIGEGLLPPHPTPPPLR